MGGDLITYAHSQLRMMLNQAALTQMTQNNTEQDVKENRTQNYTPKKIALRKCIWNGHQTGPNSLPISLYFLVKIGKLKHLM